MKYLQGLRWIILFAVQWVVYAKLFNYLFIYIEQTHLFLFSSSYAGQLLWQPGGVCKYIAEFLTQFYLFPYIGAGITALLLTIVLYLTRKVLSRISRAGTSCLLYAAPALALMVLHFDFNYYIQGTIAYIGMLSCLSLYGNVSEKKRLFTAPLCVLILFFTAGSVALLFTAASLLYDLSLKRMKPLPTLLTVCLACSVCLLSVYFSWTPDWASTLSPKQYFTPALDVNKIYYPWIALLLVMAIAFLLRKQGDKGKNPIAWVCIQWCVVGIALYGCVEKYGELRSMSYKKMDYYTRTCNWERVMDSFDGADLSVQRMVMANLAMAEQGALTDKLFDFPQKGITSLMPVWDRTVYSASLLSDIYYTMGLVSVSQKFAFEALDATPLSRNPRSLKRLIETNIITGAYPVAEKYINILEQTLYYKQWANAYRAYLYNDRAVSQDATLSLKRQCWEAEQSLPEPYSDPVSALLHILPIVPQNSVGMAYLSSFILLNKDMENFQLMRDRLYNTPAWRSLSVYQQEAIVISNPNNPQMWLQNGVSVKVHNRAIDFMNAVRSHSGRKDVAQAMAAGYANTYWYYFMFVNE